MNKRKLVTIFATLILSFGLVVYQEGTSIIWDSFLLMIVLLPLCSILMIGFNKITLKIFGLMNFQNAHQIFMRIIKHFTLVLFILAFVLIILRFDILDSYIMECVVAGVHLGICVALKNNDVR